MPWTTLSVDASPSLITVAQNASPAILANDVGLRNATIAYVRDVSQVDSRVAHYFDRQVVHFLDRSWRGVGGDVVLELIDLGGSRGRYDILRVDRIHYVLRRQSLGLKQPAIQIDHHFPLLSAVRIGHRRARNRHQLRPQEVQCQIVQVRLAESRAGEGELENRHTGGGVVNNQRRQRSRRQLAQNGLRGRGDLCVGPIDACRRL